MKKITLLVLVASLAILLGASGCTKTDRAAETPGLTNSEIDNIVRRTYQYVAMYNVINKSAMMESPFITGWNGTFAMEGLADHTVQLIARPNNDTLYVTSTLDLHNEPVIVSYPAFDSKFVCLETSAYDHYCGVPLSTTKGDFEKPVKILFYSERTPDYGGEAVDGVDRIIEMSGDFAMAFLRVMPHAAEPERMKKNMAAMQGVKVQTLSEFQGNPQKAGDAIDFPAFSSDQGVWENNFLEVMQFVFNHTTFDPTDEMDQAVLAALKPLGVEPGKDFDPEGVEVIDGKNFADTGRKVHQEVVALWTRPEGNPYVNDLFKPKGEMALEPMVIQSAYGPIGLPADQAVYPGIGTSDGTQMNALHDYVIRISKDSMPPAKAFWSVTLYDSKNGFFIPNDRKKYSVGENAGFVLDENGGLEIHIAAEKPESVPEENWLPIVRQDEDLDVVMRIYAPDLQKMGTWTVPKAEELTGAAD
ncbi:MAG: DUF1214 domain-containing protein [Thermoanaerobaculales bacterium]